MTPSNTTEAPKVYLLQGMVPSSRGNLVYFGFPPKPTDKFYEFWKNNFFPFEIESMERNGDNLYKVKCLGYDFIFLNLSLCQGHNE